MRLIDFVRQRVAQRTQPQVVRGRYQYPPWAPVPTHPGNPMMMKEPYDMFYRMPITQNEPYDYTYQQPPAEPAPCPCTKGGIPISAYVPGWKRMGNMGTVERIPPPPEAPYLTLNEPGQVGVLPSVRGTERSFPETKPIYGVRPSIRQISEFTEPYSFHQRAPPPVTAPNAWRRQEAYDFAYRGAIGSPRHQYRMPLSQKECYDFTY